MGQITGLVVFGFPVPAYPLLLLLRVGRRLGVRIADIPFF